MGNTVAVTWENPLVAQFDEYCFQGTIFVDPGIGRSTLGLEWGSRREDA